MKLKALVPLAAFLCLVVFLAIGLTRDPRELPSPLIDKAAPQFRLPVLGEADRFLSLADMRGQVWLLNVWASWCVACREEHPVLVRFAQQNVVPLIGLNYKDQADQAQTWLREGGNPYVMSVMDANGRVGIDFGVYGVPETFLIDQDGKIRHKHVGPLTDKAMREDLLPRIAKLKVAS
jgi:cytochrome c biogenesis protein CcmG, thiol:disulfide interchange protein DsbE